MTTTDIPRSAFRCTVVPEQSAALMHIGWRQYEVRIVDTSREAFTVRVPRATYELVKEGTRAVLKFNGETWDVQCIAVFRMLDDRYHLSMARVNDRTSVRGPKTSLWSCLPRVSGTDPVMPLALLLSFLFACVALPGMGDKLGTAPKIRKVVQDVWRKTLGS